jgi:drug/metabolite transporter (DMT)-like permease
MLDSWFFCIATATVVYGLSNFTYKIAASQNLSSSNIVNKASFTVAVLALISIFITQSDFINLKWLIIYALLNSSFFALGFICKISALKYIPTTYVFPVVKMNALLVIIVAIIFFGDSPSSAQWFGIGMAFLMFVFVNVDIHSKSNLANLASSKRGLLFAGISACSTACSMIVGKFASTEVPILNYMFLSYCLVMTYSFLVNKKAHGGEKIESHKKYWFFGIIAGTGNFFGYTLLLKAFSMGPLSLIQAVFSTSMIFPIVLSILFLKEKFSILKAFIVLAGLSAVILIKLTS